MQQNNFSPTRPFIFLAEDDIDDQELLTEAIANLDGTIRVAHEGNGRKAVQFLEALEPGNNPALIILDYYLPELSGAEILEQISRMDRFNNVIKIVWSTSNSPIYKNICLDLGAKAYLVKPNDLSGIRSFAKTVIELCSVTAPGAI